MHMTLCTEVLRTGSRTPIHIAMTAGGLVPIGVPVLILNVFVLVLVHNGQDDTKRV